jgi:hypothetical protein
MLISAVLLLLLLLLPFLQSRLAAVSNSEWRPPDSASLLLSPFKSADSTKDCADNATSTVVPAPGFIY